MILKKSSKNQKRKIAEKILRKESETKIMGILGHFAPNQRTDFQNSIS